MKIWFGSLSVLLALFGVLAVQKYAQAQVSGVPFFLVESDTQTSGTTVSDPSFYISERITETDPGDISAATLTDPGPDSPYTYPSASLADQTTTFYSSPSYSSLAALNADYPLDSDFTTTYTSNTDGNYDGSDTVTYDQNDLATSTPTFSAATYNALQGLNAADGITLDFDSFSGALSTSYVFVNIYDATSGDDVFDGGGGFLPSDATSVYVPGGTLDPGTSYYATLDFSNRDPEFDSNSVDVSENWDYDTSLNFATAAAPESSTSASLATLLALGLGGLVINRKKLVTGR